MALGQVVIQNILPRIGDGSFPAKAVLGDPVVISADIFKEGTDRLAAEVRWRIASGGKSAGKWSSSPMTELLNFRWEAAVEPGSLGLYEFQIEAWTDHFATWKRAVKVKSDAGQDIAVELEEGARLIEATASKVGRKQAATLGAVADTIRRSDLPPEERLVAALEAPVIEPLARGALRSNLTRSEPMALRVERPRAALGSWYELFPRSYGGLEGATKRLSAVAEMGFDVVYLPPIHPIGVTHRKGPNNTWPAEPGSPGSPWAIGSEEGGHTAIHSELGTYEDFDRMVDEASSLGMEIALDYALQCSPDHPWVTEHPEWFHHRPDGTIKYAENPPKKYQDIYPINFWPETNKKGLWQACKEILDVWIGHGVRIFRVDNPHTKPLAFWEWMLDAIFQEHPDVVFLAEAFTHPKMMAKLAELGFSQSYTYFTWRVHKHELTDYLLELAYGPLGDYMRPNFWPNTPDILSGPLRNGGPGVFKHRLVLAATLSPSYGIYSGYELCENQPARDTDEEYLNSEKYEIKNRSWDSATSLAPYIARINQIRREHPSLHRMRTLTFHHSDNPNVLVYSKADRQARDVLVIAVNLNPAASEDTTSIIDYGWLGFDSSRPVVAHELLSDRRHRWTGPGPFFRLHPELEPAQIFHLSQPSAPARAI